jgi:hypothetical protein
MQLDEETLFLKHWLESELLSLEIQIMEFPLDIRNEEFDFLIKKAINFRGLLEIIKKEMEQ